MRQSLHPGRPPRTPNKSTYHARELLGAGGGYGRPAAGRQIASAGICVVLPFFNEEAYIGETLSSLAAQTLKPAALILIDNGSTDRSASLCRAFAAAHREIPVELYYEGRPGKIHALETGCKHINAEFVAFCDADTIYPKHYLQLAASLFETEPEDVVAVMGIGVGGDDLGAPSRFFRLRRILAALILAKQCHTGGFGQILRTSSLLEVGGYSVAQWPYVLEDHEIMHRMLKRGRSLYHPALWCRPSRRRRDRSKASWTILEQALYHSTPFRWKDWYFYRFLSHRFERRGLQNVALRSKTWETMADGDIRQGDRLSS